MWPALRALVVDDSPVMRRSLVQALGRLALQLHEAEDGVEAIRKLAADRFDLVVTDINMPVMDGLKLIRHIRAGIETATLPIVVVTTEAAEIDRRKAMDLGANVYLVKPVQAHEVIEAVKPLLPAAPVE
jgi:two-component system, chemotaxis family, chemotaxis protein CheY